jgi:hypothetical protein
MMNYTFRNPEKARQYDYLAPSLQKMFCLLCHILNDMGYDIIVTSMVRPVSTIANESGVHATGRAIDCVPIKRANVKSVESSADYDQKMKIVAECINRMLPREDLKHTVVWHQVIGGGGLHFHVQVPASKDYKDLAGVIPSTDA